MHIRNCPYTYRGPMYLTSPTLSIVYVLVYVHDFANSDDSLCTCTYTIDTNTKPIYSTSFFFAIISSNLHVVVHCLIDLMTKDDILGLLADLE